MKDEYSPHPATVFCRCGWWGMVWDLVNDNRCPRCYSKLHVPYEQLKFLATIK